MSIRPRRLALRAVVTAAPAFAHVTAQPGRAEQGGYGVVSLRVPTESDIAGTVALQVTLPLLRSVRTTPMPGWTAVPQGSGETVTGVTRTADPGVRIGPGQFADFALALGPLPTDTLVLPAVQTHDDGEVVARDQPPNLDGSEPDRPAPTVEPATGGATADGTARVIGGGGLLVGALGLGGGAVLQNRPRAKETAR